MELKPQEYFESGNTQTITTTVYLENGIYTIKKYEDGKLIIWRECFTYEEVTLFIGE